ncbi:hypothetical protein [Pedobacter sp. JY14-1]|uniref:hypothetical protein n=1 Tax=Pedobacter sp. JY14-1 TaxID=3034151 RepID=UPI0023E1556E|nr:hypothetical protein [Pedobacter sp. JY14-1]
MKKTILALALVATTFGAFAQNTTPAAKPATKTEVAKPKHHKKVAKKAEKTEVKSTETKKAGK